MMFPWSESGQEFRNRSRLLAARDGVLGQRYPVRTERSGCLRLGGHDRLYNLEVAQHRGREDVHAGPVGKQKLRNVPSTHVGGRSKRGFEVASTPVPAGVR